MRANQLRLWFASAAYVLLCALRRVGLPHTQLAQATCGTIRLRLLKIGALVRVSCRRVKVAMASAFPCQSEYALAHLRLARAIFGPVLHKPKRLLRKAGEDVARPTRHHVLPENLLWDTPRSHPAPTAPISMTR